MNPNYIQEHFSDLLDEIKNMEIAQDMMEIRERANPELRVSSRALLEQMVDISRIPLEDPDEQELRRIQMIQTILFIADYHNDPRWIAELFARGRFTQQEFARSEIVFEAYSPVLIEALMDFVAFGEDDVEAVLQNFEPTEDFLRLLPRFAAITDTVTVYDLPVSSLEILKGYFRIATNGFATAAILRADLEKIHWITENRSFSPMDIEKVMLPIETVWYYRVIPQEAVQQGLEYFFRRTLPSGLTARGELMEFPLAGFAQEQVERMEELIAVLVERGLPDEMIVEILARSGFPKGFIQSRLSGI